MIGRCKDCRFLGERYVHTFYPEDPDAPEIETEYHVCNYVQHVNRSNPETPPSGDAGAKDGSGYFAALVVKDDFGCVQFVSLPACRKCGRPSRVLTNGWCDDCMGLDVVK